MASNRTLYSELPENAYGAFLYCPRCGGHYSATRGDYWNMDPNQTIVCRGERGARHRPVCMFMAREITQIVKVVPFEEMAARG